MAQKNPHQVQETVSTTNNKPQTNLWLPHIIAVVVFISITAAYFSPMIFGGKELFQEDIMRFKGMSKEITDFREKYHEEPYWTGSMFCGMPAYQISATYLAGKLEYLNKFFSLFFPHPIRYIFLCFIGFYFLLQVLKVDPWLSVIGAIAFGLSSYFFIALDAGHNSKMAAIAYMAPALAGIMLTYRGKMLLGGAITALFLTMEIFVNHPQITYYLGFLILFYGLSELFNAFKEKKLPAFFKQSAVIGIAGIIALGVNITSLWATADYSKYTIRGGTELTINPDGTKNEHNVTSGLDKDYATAWSYGVGETMTLLIPNFKGGASTPIGNNKSALEKVDPDKREAVSRMYQYFGDQPFTSGPVYAGAIVIFLFVLGLFVVKGPLKWALVLSTIISIWLSWGRNDPFGLSNFMLDHFPAYNKFRAVAMILVIAEFCIPLLGVLAIDQLMKNKNFLKENFSLPFKQILSGQKILIVSFILTGGIALLCWLAPGMLTDFSPPGEKNELFGQIKQSNPEVTDQQINTYLDQTLPDVITARQVIVKSDAMRSFFFILLAAAAIWLYAKNKLVNRKILIASLIVLIIFDMVVVDRRYLNNDSFSKSSDMKNPFAMMGRPNGADLEINKDTDPNFRVWNTLSRPDQDAATSYFHKSISGYHGAKLRRYQELIDFHINKRNMAVINMLNTKYIIVPGEKNQPMPYPNREALGNAWFVNDYKIVANPDSEITALKNFNPSTTAILDKRFEENVSGFSVRSPSDKPVKDSLANIKLTSYKTNDLVYESNSSAEGLAVFSEIYYANGWNAYVDGKLTPHFRVNYVLRAMRVPAGKHNVEFKFEPSIISTGEKISAASLVMLFLLCGFAAFKEINLSKRQYTNG
ncbi:MAG: YfhO family protein [Bacteroidetes bacterium]|nr:YfhO family protein [Bacteroidota bacterium]